MHYKLKVNAVNRQIQLPLADSIIHATALIHKTTLWSQGDDFKGHPHVKYFPKGIAFGHAEIESVVQLDDKETKGD